MAQGFYDSDCRDRAGGGTFSKAPKLGTKCFLLVLVRWESPVYLDQIRYYMGQATLPKSFTLYTHVYPVFPWLVRISSRRWSILCFTRLNFWIWGMKVSLTLLFSRYCPLANSIFITPAPLAALDDQACQKNIRISFNDGDGVESDGRKKSVHGQNVDVHSNAYHNSKILYRASPSIERNFGDRVFQNQHLSLHQPIQAKFNKSLWAVHCPAMTQCTVGVPRICDTFSLIKRSEKLAIINSLDQVAYMQ